MRLIRKTFAEGIIILDLRARNLESIFHQTLHHVIAKDFVPMEQRDRVEQALLEREQKVTTAIGNATAVPHAYLDFLERPVIVFVRLAKPLNLGAPDGIPTRFFFVMLGPTGRAAEHLDSLMHVARLMSDNEFRFEAGEATSQQELLDAFDRYSDRSVEKVVEEKEQIPEGLRYTGRPFGGLMADIRPPAALLQGRFR